METHYYHTMVYSFPSSSKGSFTYTIPDRTALISLCYTSCGALAKIRHSSMSLLLLSSNPVIYYVQQLFEENFKCFLFYLYLSQPLIFAHHLPPCLLFRWKKEINITWPELGELVYGKIVNQSAVGTFGLKVNMGSGYSKKKNSVLLYSCWLKE